jgi:putative effector of murein hydrolase LrgA (UPF0299 family)
MAEFAIVIEPILNSLTGIVTTLRDFMAGLSETEKGIIATVAQLFLLYKAFRVAPIVGPLVTGAMTGVGGALKGLGVASKTAAPSFSSALIQIGGSALAAAAGLLTLGATFLMIGIGIGVAAFGVASLVKSFAQLTGDQAIALLAYVGIIYLLVGAISSLSLTAVFAVGAVAGMAVLFTGLVFGLNQIADVAKENEELVNTLENLALISAGTSAKMMSGQASQAVVGIQEAISAVYQQKIEIVLTVEEGELISNIKAKLQNDYDFARAVVSTAN